MLVLVEDGSVVVLLFGGLVGVNWLVWEIGEVLVVVLVIIISGELCFGICVFNLFVGYVLVDLE